MSPKRILLHPIITEKTMNMTDQENKLVFQVSQNSNKTSIKETVEKLYKVKVNSVNTVVTQKGKKRAIVQLNSAYNALDISSKMGVV